MILVMRRTTESWRPPKSAGLVQQAVDDIVLPSDPELARWFMQYCHAQAERIAYDLDQCRSVLDLDSRILEIGCIPPILTLALKGEGYDVVGVDIQPERFSATLSKFGIRVEKVDIEQDRLPFTDASLDAVVFNEVIEHLRINPIHTISEIARILRPGGLLLLSTPNLNFYRFRPPPDLFEEYEKIGKIGHMGHFRIFSPVEIIDLLARFGFETQELIYRGRLHKWVGNVVCHVIPQLRPYFSLISSRSSEP